MARAFKVILKEGDKAKFYDNLDTPIPEAGFSNIIKSFHRGSCFFVHVIFKIENNEQPAVITSFVRERNINLLDSKLFVTENICFSFL